MEETRCQAITNSGEQCTRMAKEGKKFCGTHAESETVETLKVLSPDLPAVKIIQRYISKTAFPQGGAVSNDDVQSYLTSYINIGYKLFNTHYIGETPEGVGVLFILTL